MNRRQMLAGGSAVATGASVTAVRVDAPAFGATGDGVADDAPAIQAALDHLGERGGGVVSLPAPRIHYRIARGLVLPSNVVLEGAMPVRYPFSAGNHGVCALVADFTDHRQWMIEPATKVAGARVPFDGLVAGSLPDGVTYNCGVRNLLLSSHGRVPFGGIRMHGCPGSIVEGVSIDRVGCGLLVNFSFGGRYQVHAHTLYYGVAAWDDANANLFEVYCAQASPWPKTVPADYRLPFMAQMSGHFIDTLKLSTDDHAARPWGVLCGSIASTATSNAFDAVVERFAGGIFLYNAYATDFRCCYLEAGAGGMACAIAASRARFGIQELHAFLSGTGAVFDLGIDVLARIFASGIIHAATFGKPPIDDGSSQMILEGVDPGMPGAPVQRGVRYMGKEPGWTPLTVQGGWRAAADHEAPAARFDPWSHRVELRGSVAGGAPGGAAVLPRSWRPAARRRFAVAGGRVEIDAEGGVRVMPDAGGEGGIVSFDGISYARW